MKKSILVTAVFLLTNAVAFAHTELSMSMPADKATLATPPKEVMLHFTEPVRLTAATIQKSGDKTAQDLGPLPAAAANAFTLAVPAMTNGGYTVTWRALADDGHIMKGELTFSIGAADAAAGHSQADHSHHSDSTEHAHSEHSDSHQ